MTDDEYHYSGSQSTTNDVATGLAPPSNVNHMSGMGDRIRNRRDSLGMTQPQLGERSGYAQQNIAKIEAGGTANPGKLDRIARVLGVSIA